MANPYFNAAYYLANNPDLVLAGLTEENVEQHYLQYGAAESVRNPARNPNPWFDAGFYLRANPDLIAAGLTPADALAHFANYGVTEGRVFSPNPAMDPAAFDAVDYATRYPDVAEAFDIDPEEELTVAQEGQLMGHFLAYGVHEGRTAEPASFNNAANSAVIPVLEGEVTLGTIGDDNFGWSNTTWFNEAAINGLAGNDTLTIRSVDSWGAFDLEVTATSLENINIEALDGNSTLTVHGAGVQNVAVDTNAVDGAGGAFTFNYVGDLVESFQTAGVGVVTAEFDGSADGEEDALELTSELGGSFVVDATEGDGIESLTLNVLEEGTGNTVTVNVGSVEGESLSITINSDVEEFTVNLQGVDAGDLETVTLDASGANGIQFVVAAGLVAATVDVTQIGSDGRDVLSAYAGIDTLTGNAGDDEFIFTSAAASIDDGELDGIDTITDFEAGDVISYVLTVQGPGVLNDGVEDIGTVNAAGVLTFKHGFTTGRTLEDIIIALEAANSDAVAFKFGVDTYVFTSATVAGSDITDADLIKLAGVNAADLELAATGVSFAA